MTEDGFTDEEYLTDNGVFYVSLPHWKLIEEAFEKAGWKSWYNVDSIPEFTEDGVTYNYAIDVWDQHAEKARKILETLNTPIKYVIYE